MKKLLTLILLLLISFSTHISVAKEPTADEIKAVLIAKLIKFVEWPKEKMALNDEYIDICVLGNNEIYKTLKVISNSDSLINIYNIKNIKNALFCEALYIDKSVISLHNNNFSRLKNLPILTISDYKNFREKGGIITIKPVNKKISFSINNKIAINNRIKISSKLLNLSRK